MKAAAASFAIVLLLSACARTAPPAPAMHYGLSLRQMAIAAAAVPFPPAMARAPAAAPAKKTVQKTRTQTIRYVLVSPSPASSREREGARALPRGKGEGLSRPSLAKQSIPLPPAAGEGTQGLIWPVRGRVISSYGPKGGGLYNDGINIAAPKGTPVKAAADGVVAYIGHGLESYGNLVLIRHRGGLVTAYAHLEGVRVKKGAPVRKGQAIGAVGTSGAVTAAQLHFEIRERGDAVDPVGHLG